MGSTFSEIPELTKEWHQTKNEPLTPNELTRGSRKKVWWKCEYNHAYKLSVYEKSRRKTCPICKREASLLKNKHPELLTEYHPTKNKRPFEDIAINSIQKVWWVCSKGHEWQSTPRIRTKDSTVCPYCSRKRASKEYNLKKMFPDLMDEWDNNKNKEINPETLLPYSHKEVWWKCKHVPEHVWSKRISSRTKGNSPCPYCSNRRISKDNSFGYNHKRLLDEWHPTKNKKRNPYEIIDKSNEKVWWKCCKGHEWKTKLYQRTYMKTNCPICFKGRQTSFPEQLLYYYFKRIFPDTLNTYKSAMTDNREIDIFIPSLKIGIEYDGRHHDSKVGKKRDEEKNKALDECGIRLFRIRIPNLPQLKAYNAISMEHDYPAIHSLENCFNEITTYIMDHYPLSEATIEKIKSLQNEDFKEKESYILEVLQKDEHRSKLSLKRNYPEIAMEWHQDKNGDLKPEHVAAFSKRKVWWVCKKGHEWKTDIYTRTKQGSGCPSCYGRRATDENNLATIHPDLIPFWHKRKNGRQQPDQVMPNSNQTAWWRCSKGHEWDAFIYSVVNSFTRTSGKRVGCPYCYGKRVSRENSLTGKRPDLAKQWHPDKNGELTPDNIAASSSKNIWWMCENGHEWRTTPNNRNRSKKARCKTCASLKKK